MYGREPRFRDVLRETGRPGLGQFFWLSKRKIAPFPDLRGASPNVPFALRRDGTPCGSSRVEADGEVLTPKRSFEGSVTAWVLISTSTRSGRDCVATLSGVQVRNAAKDIMNLRRQHVRGGLTRLTRLEHEVTALWQFGQALICPYDP
jgi:hypothetical protein